jgi:hypothetical protein
MEWTVVRELHNGTGSYDFDWEVRSSPQGVRKDYQVIRARSEMRITRMP